ncbi:MAG TPA: diguanylate cyclase [Candidatus Limnocylindrales bacterium]|nr:diguanylate cyclase [Candidatus Limnocylindrales bacterium]
MATLSLAGVSCFGLAVLGSEHVRATALETTASADRAGVDSFISELTTHDIAVETLPVSRRTDLEVKLDELVRANGLDAMTLATPDGRVLAGDVLAAAGDAALDRVSATSSADVTLSADTVLTEAFPISIDGRIRLVVIIQRDGAPIVAAVAAARRDLLVVAIGAAIVFAILLRAIFRAAGIRLRDQAEALAESRRRDALTGLLNHGAAVSLLGEVLARATADAEAVGICLVDIDNFRLLNDTYGSDAGDEALAVVARALESEATAWHAIARFGPDEFLAIAPAAVARSLPDAMERVQFALRATSVRFDESELLPLTVSAGVTYFPFHAGGVNELLSAATVALGEAKAGGGDRTIIADAWANEPKRQQTSFDVLQGLVTAIDNKDRYTKRHSEDVATYALFLASRSGLDDALLPTLRTAGLLHDIGKIGVPDDILRKPGRLTPYEYEIVKQHVALGDLIVRGLPDIDHVRAGVRHHHERWDGQGYLDGLTGVGIPLIARILAVCDAFSAMTTTRPYRKALSVEEALDELRAGAGGQLDPALVATFVDGIENDPDAPLPGADRTSIRLWTPTTRAA